LGKRIVDARKDLFPYGEFKEETDVFQALNGFYCLGVEFEHGPVRFYYGHIDGVEVSENGTVIRFNFKMQHALGKEEEFAVGCDLDWMTKGCKLFYKKGAGISQSIKDIKFDVFSSDGKQLM